MKAWPQIPYEPWKETCTLLHMMVQIVGKYRLAHTPWINHSWHATLYPTARGLTTGLVPDPAVPTEVRFDFVEGAVVVEAHGGARSAVPLEPTSVAAFDAALRDALAQVGGTPDIHCAPNEVDPAVPFAQNTEPRPFDGDAVRRWHRALLSLTIVMERFRSAYIGKVSPVHLFWGSFDLAVTRFSGRQAPPHPGGMPALPHAVGVEAYSHEVASAGFWPGMGIGEPMVYAYTYPTKPGFAEHRVSPSAARWDETLGEFLLPYEALAASATPEADLYAFLETTWQAAKESLDWPAGLECPAGTPRVPRPVAA